MSQFRVPVVQISKVGKHPNADSLSITQVEGCPVIFKTGGFEPGDLAVYVPVDSVVSVDRPEFAWLKTKEGQSKVRIKAKKLRGIFSMGLLVPLKGLFDDRSRFEVGQDLAADLKIEKYEEDTPIHMNTGNEHCPWAMPVYDMESYRKFKGDLVLGEKVMVTEKIHGCNGRFMYKEGRLWVGSHRTVKLRDEHNLWWGVAQEHKLEEKLAPHPGLVLYGEVYGNVQDLKYDCKPGEARFAAFDIFDSTQGRWLDVDEFFTFCLNNSIPTVPILYEGPYLPEVVEPLADGKSTIAGHIREGWVIKPWVYRESQNTGSRVILKLVSEAYLLRKDGSEHH